MLAGVFTMTIGSLFAGIGGLELGLEYAGFGPVIWQVEIDPKLRNCLSAHWPNAIQHEDIRTVGSANLVPVDLICGGFPCQDISSVGKRAGIHGSRSGLWLEMERVVGELRPRWVVVENVASGATKWVDHIRLALAKLGYASLPVPIAASDCGAWHRRARVFVVAYASSERQNKSITKTDTKSRSREARQVSISRGATAADACSVGRIQSQASGTGERERGWPCNNSMWSVEPDVARMVYGFPGRLHRECALGNSVCPPQAQVVGEVINLLRRSL